MKGILAYSALLVTLLLAALIVESGHAYENTLYGFSINPPETWTIEDNFQAAQFTFRDPSNHTGGIVTIQVNQSGLPQDDPFLASRIHGYLMHYLYDNYEGYLITEMGAKAVYNLNGYEIKFNTTLDGKEMKFDSVIFVKSNQTFYIVCGALSPAYDSLALDFEESINSFRLAPYSQSSNNITQSSSNYTPQDDTIWLLIGTCAVISVSLIPAVIYFYRRKHE